MNKREKYITKIQSDWIRAAKDLAPEDIITVSFSDEPKTKDLVLVLNNGVSILDYYHYSNGFNVYKITDAYRLIQSPDKDDEYEYKNYIYTLEDAVQFVDLRENNQNYYYKWKMFQPDEIGKDIMKLQYAARKVYTLPSLYKIIRDNIYYLENVNSVYLNSKVGYGPKS